MTVYARSAGGVWIGLSGRDVPRADEVSVFWGKEKKIRQFGDAAQSDEEIGVGEVGWDSLNGCCAKGMNGGGFQRTFKRTRFAGRKRMAGDRSDSWAGNI